VSLEGGRSSKSRIWARGSSARRGRTRSRKGAGGQPLETLLSQDLGDAGAVERHALGAERGGDLDGRVPGLTQLHDPGAGSFLGRGTPAGQGAWAEEVQMPGAEVADQRCHRCRGVAEPGCCLLTAEPLQQVGAERLVLPLPCAAWGQKVGPILPDGGVVSCMNHAQIRCDRKSVVNQLQRNVIDKERFVQISRVVSHPIVHGERRSSVTVDKRSSRFVQRFLLRPRSCRRHRVLKSSRS
jgi:hypothetical protein